MSQQGGRPTRHEDEWWGQLYDDTTDDTGPAPAPDSLDDRFASASGAVGGARGATQAEAYPADQLPEDEPNPRHPQGRATPQAPEPGPAPTPGPASTPGPALTPGPASTPGPALTPRPASTPGPAPTPRPASTPGAAPAPGSAPAPIPDRGPDHPDREPGWSWNSGWNWGPGRPRTSDDAEEPDRDPTPESIPPPTPESIPTPDQATAMDRATVPYPRQGGDADRDAEPAQAGDLGDPVPGPLREGDVARNPASEPGRDGELADNQVPEPTRAADLGGNPLSEPERDGDLESNALSEPLREGDSGLAAPVVPAAPASPVDHVGSGPPTYDAEPTALPPADPGDLGDLVPDTVLDGARYGACTLRAVSVRGDSARFRGEPRRDALLTARFGTGERALVLVAMATGARAAPGAHRAASELCRLIGQAIGRSHTRLVEDIHAARRGELKSGLQRLTDRGLGKLRAVAAERGADPEEYAASLRCLLLPARPDCRTRVFFGVGEGGLFRLRDGVWRDIEPRVTTADTTGAAVVGFGSPPAETPEGDRFTMDLGIPTPPSPYEPAPEPAREPFRFRASVARPGDALLMCSPGMADPLNGEPALCAYLARRWSGGTAPGLAAFLADSQVRVKGYADDRTLAAVWEA